MSMYVFAFYFDVKRQHFSSLCLTKARKRRSAIFPLHDVSCKADPYHYTRKKNKFFFVKKMRNVSGCLYSHKSNESIKKYQLISSTVVLCDFRMHELYV